MSLKDPDFSRKATQDAVLSSTVQHPMTLGPAALGILGGTATLLFNLGPLGVAAGACGLGLGLGSFCYNYFLRKDVFASRYLAKAHKVLAEKRRQAVEAIKNDISQLSSVPGAESYASQGASQFDMAQKKFKNLEGILSSKFT